MFFLNTACSFWTNPERSSQQYTNCTSTYILSHKRSWKVNEDMFFWTQRAVLNKSWKKQPTTHQLYVHLHPISQTILESQRRHVFFNTACCFEQILEEAANNTPTVRPLTSYLTNHPGKSTKTCFFLTKRAVLTKSWKKQPTTHQLYVHLHPISQTILESQLKHVFLNTACCFEQILKEAANNTPTVRPLTSYLTNHPGKSTKTMFFSTQLAVLNKSWKKQSTTHQLYVHLHPISQTILESQRRYVFF